MGGPTGRADSVLLAEVDFEQLRQTREWPIIKERQPQFYKEILRRLMDNERTLCVICAWRKDYQKKFLRARTFLFDVPEFTKDISIKDGVKPDDKEENSGDNK